MTQYIGSRKEFFNRLRQGPFTSVGGYPVYFACNNGTTISFNSALENAKELGKAIGSKDFYEHVIFAADINWESDLTCDISGEPIKSAYGAIDIE